MILQESFQLLIVYNYDFTPWLLTLLLNYVFIKIILLWGKGIWKTLSLACSVIYTGSCNTCNLCHNTFAVCVLLRQEAGLWRGPDGGHWLDINLAFPTTWVTVIGMNCCYFPGVPGLQCWAVTGCCWGLGAAELQGTRCQPWLPSPSRGMFGSLAHQASCVCIKGHIKTLGLWLHFQFLGLRKLLASRGQETRNFRVTGSKALSCVCTLI